MAEGGLSLGSADFSVLTVRGVRFQGDIDLTRCLFEGPVRFINCRFRRIDMALAKFNGPLLLGWCSTPEERIEEIILRDAKFNFTKIQNQHIGSIDMFGTHMPQTCSLRGSSIGELDLEGSTIEGELDIRGCSIGRLCLMDICLLGRIGEDWNTIRDSKQATTKDIRRWNRLLREGGSEGRMREIMGSDEKVPDS